MPTKPADSPFANLYAAKREYEELRRGLSRALAKWTDGSVEFGAIFPAIEAFEVAHRHLIETIYSYGSAVPQVTPKAPEDSSAVESSAAPPARKARTGKR